MWENRGGSLVGGCAPAPARVEEGPTQMPTAYGRDRVKVNQRSRGLGALLWSRRTRFGATTWAESGCATQRKRVAHRVEARLILTA
jgi:hypothetical protein